METNIDQAAGVIVIQWVIIQWVSPRFYDLI